MKAHIPWYESLDAPGAFQMGHLRRLMESLPDPLQRVPDQSLLADEAGTGNEHVAVTRDARGRYALAYSAAGRPFALKLDRLASDTLRAAWFDPREGAHRPLGDVARRGTREFAPPTQGEGQDWILVLNDASRNFPLPVRLGEAPCVAQEAGGRDSRPRVIIETDAGGDPDDEQSLVRFLVYANEFDIEGIIANRPVARDRENQNRIRDGLGIVRAQIDAYGRCYANLVQHDPRFPKPKDLLARTVAGYDDTEDGVWANQKDTWRGTTSRDNDYLRANPNAMTVPPDLPRRLLEAHHLGARMIGLKLLNRCNVPDSEIVGAIVGAMNKRDGYESCGGMHELGQLLDRRKISDLERSLVRALRVALSPLVDDGVLTHGYASSLLNRLDDQAP